MTNSKHTPTPCGHINGVYTQEDGYFSMIQTPDKCIAYVFDKDDAAHIVKCVNMHDELVEALKPFATEVLDNYDDDSYPDVCTPQEKAYRKVITVLKKAGEL